MTTWSHVTVGVADLDQALDLWVDTFGLEIAAQSEGPDAELATLWALEPADIARQALVRTPGQQRGMLHLVEFVDPDPPVRRGANVFDLVPKNLDIHVQDLPTRYAALKAAGHQFRTDSYSTVDAPSGVTFREIHMPAHDDTNIVLLEVLGEQLPYSDKGYAGIGLVITIVPDAEAEKRFYAEVLGLEVTAENYLAGPEIEKMVGLPTGSALNIVILGSKSEDFGLMELVEYQGVEGRDLYPAAKPKALGMLMVSYEVPSLQPLRQRLQAAAVEYATFESIATLTGRGAAIAFHSPAGFRIEVHERKERPL